MSNKAVILAKGGQGGEKACDWKTCDKKHEFDVTYPNDGVVERRSLSDWAHPSAMVALGIHTPTIYPKEPAPLYPYQRHHVIPCAVFKQLPNIKDNLKLLGFNINEEGLNGISLPRNPEDIRWHDIQAHRGSHPIYNDLVEQSLGKLESQVEKFCGTDDQLKLWEKISETVKDFRERILRWQCYLRSSAVIERAAAIADVAANG